MLEEWLREEMRPRNQLRGGTWIAKILSFRSTPNVALGYACICEGNATGDPFDASKSTGPHSEAKMKFKSQCQTTKSEGV